MSKGCKEIALAVGLGAEFAVNIHRDSPMHDAGKIGVPDQALLKPGKLDAGEWDIMKTHAAMGADIKGVAPVKSFVVRPPVPCPRCISGALQECSHEEHEKRELCVAFPRADHHSASKNNHITNPVEASHELGPYQP